MWVQDELHTFTLQLGEWTDTWGCIMDLVHHREIPLSIFDFPSRLHPLPFIAWQVKHISHRGSISLSKHS